MERNSEKGKNILKENERKDIPVELEFEYLQKLPLKSAISWAEMIGSADFSQAILSKSVAKPRILFTSYVRSNRWFHSILQEKPPELLSPNNVFLPCLVCDSCKYVSQMVLGLVCCHEEGNCVIYNPSAGKFKALPKVDLSEADEAHFFLGFDQESQKFKVLCVVTGPTSMEYQVISLLDKEDKSWRKVDCEISHIPTTYGLWLDGKVYYGACSKTNEDHFFLMCFNLEKEKFGTISIPEEANSGLKFQHTLAKIKDKLALVKNYPDEVKIWILEATTWSKLPFDIPSSFINEPSFNYECVGTIGTGQFIFAPRFVCKGELHIIYYDFGEQRLEKIIIEGDIPVHEAHVDVFLDYIENPTLNSIENIKDIISKKTPM